MRILFGATPAPGHLLPLFPLAELFAVARVDLTWDEALSAARVFEPDLLVGEWVDFVTPLLGGRRRMLTNMFVTSKFVTSKFVTNMFVGC